MMKNLEEKGVLKLRDYAEDIQLHKAFVAEENSDESRESIVDFLLSELGVHVPTEYQDIGRKRKLLHGKLNTLPAKTLSVESIRKLDTLLQSELQEKTVIDVSNLPSNCTLRIGSTDLILWQGDIAQLEVDAIVNAANKRMLGCFHPLHKCIDNVIHSAAGVQLRDDCQVIMDIQGVDEPTGCAKITRAYNLPSKYVIHTVGPIVTEDVSEQNETDLVRAYTSCLELCKEVGTIKSLAFCCISTGVFGYPAEQAARVAYDTVRMWVQENPGTMDAVVFNVFLDSDRDIYKSLVG